MPAASVYCVPVVLPGCGLPPTSVDAALDVDDEVARRRSSRRRRSLTTSALTLSLGAMSLAVIVHVLSSPTASTTAPQPADTDIA